MVNLLRPFIHTFYRFECRLCRNGIKSFLPFGIVPRPNAQCPARKSLERHRLVWLYFRRETNLFADKLKMLHLAPEFCLSRHLQKLPNIDCISADLNPSSAMVQMDITNIHFRDDAFDVIYASHVLEHIQEDIKAMRELDRILKPQGWAILQVPILVEGTFEDPAIDTPEERERLLGQHDHVRKYGLDYKDRLSEAGFKVKVQPFVSSLSLRKRTRYGLVETEDIYYCLK